MSEKIYGLLFKGEEVVGDNFLINFAKELRDNGLFLVYQTTRHTPCRLKIVDAEEVKQ